MKILWGFANGGMVDTITSTEVAERREGSNPSLRTIMK